MPFGLLTCSKLDDSITTKIIGHGASGLQIQNAIYHDNSMEAIDYALSLPHCAGVELDVRLDAEGELWLYHDDFLESETNGFACISEKTSNDLIGIQYNSLHKESLVHLRSTNVGILSEKYTFLDLKPWNACQNEVLDAVLFKNKILELNMDTSKFGIIVPNLELFHALKLDFQVFLSVENISELSSEFLNNEPRFQGIVIRNKNITKEEVNFLKSIHKKTIIFDVRSPKGIKSALNKNPSYLLCDDVKLAVGLLY